jgi:hypothetical protein
MREHELDGSGVILSLNCQVLLEKSEKFYWSMDKFNFVGL